MVSFLIRLAVVATCILSFAGGVAAEGFALYEYSSRGVALGGTVLARKPDASAVAHNPALLTRLPGINTMAGVSLIKPQGKMTTFNDAGEKETTKLRESEWIIPHLYYTHQLSDKFTFGIGEFSRFGLGFEYPHNWPGRFNIYEVNLQSFSINPNMAWAVSDSFSLAAGLEILHVDLDMKKRVKVEPGGDMYMEVDSNIQKATDTGLGFNLAGHYQFNDTWAMGLTYRSKVRVHAKGDIEYSLVDHNIPVPGMAEGAFATNFRDGKAHATVVLPESISGGISYSPNANLSFEVGATWTRWSTFRSLNIHLPEPIGESRSPKQWENVWRIGVGVEYEPNDWLALRLGYTFDESPMTGYYADYLIPTKDRHLWSFGAGFKLNDAWTLDLAYCLIDARRRSYSASAETGVVNSYTNESNSTHIVTASVGYKF